MDSQISNSKYQEATDWLFSQLPMFSRVGAPAYKPGLETTISLDRLYGHPHKDYITIHVGGTNGKGSTSHMIASVLQAAGYKTGLYTSPHLTDFRERMRVNGKMISKEDVVEFVKTWKEKGSDLRPSFFELTMMMAFDWFRKEKVDVAVIEVGMGGRLDSTNVISPILSVITNISKDHTQFLGTTVEEIAVEKAGIIKEGIPVVIGEAVGNVKDIFKQHAEEKGSEIIFANEDYSKIYSPQKTEEGWNFILPQGQHGTLPLAGSYQKMNLVTALCAIAALRTKGLKIEPTAVAEGMRNVVTSTGLRGRWQLVSENPQVICDTGHNIAGLSETISTLKSKYAGRKLRFVVGFVNDKDVAHIVDLFPSDATYYFCKAQIPRAMDENKVVEFFNGRGITGKAYPTVKSAYEAARRDSSPDDVIYVGGSTFIVADFLNLK